MIMITVALRSWAQAPPNGDAERLMNEKRDTDMDIALALGACFVLVLLLACATLTGWGL